ncbi:MAG: transglutaminase family protein [Planctomycetaceae bacterium]
MHYKIRHVTTYTYSTPVSVCHNLVMLTPREDARLHVHQHRLDSHPAPQFVSRRQDAFGNHVHVFSIEESHKQLTVTASNRVTVLPRDLAPADVGPAWEQLASDLRGSKDPAWMDASRFLFDSPRIRRSQDFARYASGSFPAQRPILEGLRDLTQRIHADFRYDKSATDVGTATEDAFRLRSGVCQDFAHVEIACLRSLGIPARYVSGYLRTAPPAGRPRLVGADQSHAWAAVYCGPQLGWVEVDPTNDCLCGTDHIPIAWGRDYNDVAPLRGVFLGGGDHQLRVSVDVSPVEDAESQVTV